MEGGVYISEIRDKILTRLLLQGTQFFQVVKDNIYLGLDISLFHILMSLCLIPCS